MHGVLRRAGKHFSDYTSQSPQIDCTGYAVAQNIPFSDSDPYQNKLRVNCDMKANESFSHVFPPAAGTDALQIKPVLIVQ